MDMPPKDPNNNVKDNMENAAKGVLNETKDNVRELKGRMEAVGSCIDDMACKATKEASELANSVTHKLSDAADCVKDEIRKNPVQSAVIAMAIGVVGALLYKRAA